VPLFVRKLMLDQFIFDAIIRERAGGIEAERSQVTGQHFHGRNAAGFDRLDELGTGLKRKILTAPETEALCISKVVNCGGPGCRDINHAGIGQRMLEPQARTSLLGSGDITAFTFSATGILHGMALVEYNGSIEIGSQPFDDLLDAGNLLAPVVGA